MKKKYKRWYNKRFLKFKPKIKQLAKILSGGRSSQIVDLTQKLRERPTPKFSEAVVSCDRVSHRILIAGTEPGRLG